MTKRKYQQQEDDHMNEGSYLILDTETEGLSDDCHIIEIAWKLVKSDDVTTVLESFTTLIQPEEGWRITGSKWKQSEAFFANGITFDACQDIGISKEDMMLRFMDAVGRATVIFAHNIPFDLKMILKFCTPDQKDILASKTYACTLQLAKKALPLIKPKHTKGFALKEVHNSLFQEPIKDQHRAMGDVNATCRCLKSLLEVTTYEEMTLSQFVPAIHKKKWSERAT
jgi:DNA polymerase III alpha subunit (gram-positive type)